MTNPPEPSEIEWQYDAPDLEQAAAWLAGVAIPGYGVRPKSDRILDDAYYDTGNWAAHRAGYTVRIRRTASGATLTLKTMAASQDAVRSRREYEEPLPDATPESALRAPGAAGERLRLMAGRSPLAALFAVRTHRRAYFLSDGDGDVAEIAVDSTTFPGSADERLDRIEIEMLPGVPLERGRRFVDVFVVACGLAPAVRSKFETGLAAAALSGPTAYDFGPTKVNADMAASEVAFAILRKQFATFLAWEPGTRLGEDVEALHDMRVASRRMRAAMAAFAEYLPPTLERQRLALGWIASALGEVRDLDVHLEEFEAYHATLEPQLVDGMREIEAVLRSDRDAARKRMLRALDSRRYELFVQAFGSVLRRPPASAVAPGRDLIVFAGPRLLRRRYKRFRAMGDRIRPDSEPARYHELRILAKKLRYAVEFLTPVYGPGAVEFSRSVTELQDLLGRHQDLEVATSTLSEVALRPGVRLSPRALIAVGTIAERNRLEGAALRAEFPKRYRPLKGAAWTSIERACAEAITSLAAGIASGDRADSH